ncbi:MAG TPA: DUF4367 domain-containing protein [Candidatus Hungatella pullicola]|nr:DUF4367 domain-containing protein [Candidatus Hungatella pullicola]
MSKDLRQKKSDYLLELALEEQLEQDEELLKYTEDSNTPPHQFSPEHEKKMEEIFKLAHRTEMKSVYRRRFYRTAAGIALFLVLSGVMVGNVEAFRVPVINFISEITDEYSFFKINNENNINVTKHFQEFEPQVVLDGFSIEKIEESDEQYRILYQNSDNTKWYYIIYNHTPLSFAIDTENSSSKNMKINGNDAIVISKSQELRIIMYTTYGHFKLYGTISLDEGIKILESIN